MAAISISHRLQVNRFFLRLAKCRTSYVDPESKRNLHPIPLVPRVQGAHSKVEINGLGVQPYCNLREKFRYKRPRGVADYRVFNDHTQYAVTRMAKAKADELKKILSDEVPLCTGVVPLDTNNSRLFYRKPADGGLGYTFP